ncbi:hypothetical protein ACI65C_013413 [Semiaphis heraclei]
MSKNNCCVVHCSNTYKNSTGILFYNFPNRKYEVALKEKWIRAVNRVQEDGKLWRPQPRTLICSAHFIGNKRSHDPSSPSYIPTIFPKVYKIKETNQEQKNARYERSKKRKALESNTVSSTVTTNISESLIELNDSLCSYNKTMINKSTQVAFDGIENCFVFNCEYEGNNAATQVTIPNNFMEFNKPKTEDKSCGVESTNNNSCLSCNTFHGFQSIESEQSLKDITGITFKIFDFLLSLIPNNINSRTILSCYTVKVLVAITPNGMVSFLSKAYGGWSSDTFITNDCGFLDKLEIGDEVLADKGFPGIKSGIEGQNSILVMPPILHNRRFSEEELLKTYNVASVRIHVERFFARLKLFNVFNKITINLLPHIDDILLMCCILVNLSSPIIKQ